MTIKLTSNVFGAWRGVKGQIVTRPDAEAIKLIAGGYAVRFDPPQKSVDKLQTATINDQLETATIG